MINGGSNFKSCNRMKITTSTLQLTIQGSIHFKYISIKMTPVFLRIQLKGVNHPLSSKLGHTKYKIGLFLKLK